jgi:toxin-antitoxin system PIN domain toxin
MRALLDVNVLIALSDAHHVHHNPAKRWLMAHATEGWASCPLTQNGAVRILSQPNYTNPRPLSDVLTQVTGMCRGDGHQFWADDITILDPKLFNHGHVHGHRQLTDVYLLGLAMYHQGCFVTLDGQIPLSSVKGAQPHHLVKI